MTSHRHVTSQNHIIWRKGLQNTQCRRCVNAQAFSFQMKLHWWVQLEISPYLLPSQIVLVYFYSRYLFRGTSARRRLCLTGVRLVVAILSITPRPPVFFLFIFAKFSFGGFLFWFFWWFGTPPPPYTPKIIRDNVESSTSLKKGNSLQRGAGGSKTHVLLFSMFGRRWFLFSSKDSLHLKLFVWCKFPELPVKVLGYLTH